jgi:hypothetical protein
MENFTSLVGMAGVFLETVANITARQKRLTARQRRAGLRAFTAAHLAADE